jgi:hypothetical protein
LVTDSDAAETRPSKSRQSDKGRPSLSKPTTAGKQGHLSGHKNERFDDHDRDQIAGTTAPRRVEVSLGQIAPILSDALRSGRCWLQDFADDTVSIDADLYEILLAYAKLRRHDAA